MVELNNTYTLRNGETVLIDGLSMYQEFNGKPVDIYTSNTKDGCWNKKGLYMPNTIFGEKNQNELDIILK